MKSALLLSGGMDSVCIAWWKRPDYAITIDYGQMPADAELEASRAVCDALEIFHHVIMVDCRSLGSGDMAGLPPDSNAPATDWWPFRNQMLLTFAAMKAIAFDVDRILIGTVLSDGSHQDGTVEFIEKTGDLLSMQEGGLQLEAPAIQMTTNDLIEVSRIPDSILAWSHSCHRANVPCGDCRGCNKYSYVMERKHAQLVGLGGSTSAR